MTERDSLVVTSRLLGNGPSMTEKDSLVVISLLVAG